MAQEAVVFADAVASLKKSLGARFTPQVQAELKALGLDFDKLQVAYPLNQWLQALHLVSRHVVADVPVADRFRHLGRLFIQGFVQTPMGFAALTAARVFGVKRTLLRMGRNFRTATNYAVSEERDVGPKEVQLRICVAPQYLPGIEEKSALFLEYRHGVLEGVLEVLGVRGTVEVLSVDLPKQDFTYRVTWD
jgi:uncharacterized protein (TIGR02265 family)